MRRNRLISLFIIIIFLAMTLALLLLSLGIEFLESEVVNFSITPVSTKFKLETKKSREEVDKEFNEIISLQKEQEEFKDETSEDNLIYLGQFLLTGYDDCYECQEEWVGTTALGVAPQVNHTIAVDPNIIPLGSHVMINGIEYVAEDVGGGVNGNHIDIFVGSHQESFSDYCNGYADVYLIGV